MNKNSPESQDLLAFLSVTKDNQFDATLLDFVRRWNLAAYGPGKRTEGTLDHIRKELVEIEKDPSDPIEWVDVILLALNGLMRLDYDGDAIIQFIRAKMAKNALRDWPDWTKQDPNKAITHTKSQAEIAARKAYELHADNHPTIHSNRFPTWEELDPALRDQWMRNR